MAADEWIEMASAALDKLLPPHKNKKRNTIIAVVDAKLSGRSVESALNRPDTGSRISYYSSWVKSENFVSVLNEVLDIAQRWQSEQALEALQKAAHRLALASPIAAGKLVQQLSHEDAAIVLRAAIAILDRAGIETARKSRNETTASVDIRQLNELSDAELEAIVRRGLHGSGDTTQQTD
jgi:hypothetical protein